MCGRVAQTQVAWTAAAKALGTTPPPPPPSATTTTTTKQSTNGSNHSDSKEYEQSTNTTVTNDTTFRSFDWKDNFNLSPGMDATVFWMEDGKLEMGRKVWGLVTKAGTQTHPLPSSNRKERMAMHFSNLMYNARTDTLYSKPTFARLLSQGRTCVVALDGYFEWKTSPLGGGKGKKQPYYLYNKKQNSNNHHNNKDSIKNDDNQTDNKDYSKSKIPKQPYLLLAGLWTRVNTGLSEEPTLDTFTVLTTEACSSILWLHHRMPVCIWSMQHAMDWLNRPSPTVLNELDQTAKEMIDGFEWHMVTTEMSSVKYRKQEAIKALPPPKSVASFFNKVHPTSKEASKSNATRTTTTTKTEEPVKLRSSSSTTTPIVKDKEPQTEKSSLLGMKRRTSSWQQQLPSPDKKKTKASPIKQQQLPRPDKKTKASPIKQGSITAFFAPKKKN